MKKLCIDFKTLVQQNKQLWTLIFPWAFQSFPLTSLKEKDLVHKLLISRNIVTQKKCRWFWEWRFGLFCALISMLNSKEFKLWGSVLFAASFPVLRSRMQHARHISCTETSRGISPKASPPGEQHVNYRLQKQPAAHNTLTPATLFS